MKKRSVLPIVAACVSIAACTPSSPDMRGHGEMSHGPSAQSQATSEGTTASTYVPGNDIDLSALPLATGSTMIRVQDGDILRLDPMMVRRNIAGKDVLQYGYNGQIPGPLLVVRQGSTFTVQVKNRIGQPTTIHWHGIRVENRFDGTPGLTQSPIQPEQSFSYTVTVPDAGVYWYHPHVREDLQQDLGLYGNIIVLGKDEPEPSAVPILLALDDILLEDDGSLAPYGKEDENFSLMGRFGNTQLVNGSVMPTIHLAEGTNRLFITNVASTRTYRISIDGAQMRQVGGDIGFSAEMPLDEVIIGPAERAIVDVKFPTPGTYAVLHRSTNETVSLATLLVSGGNASQITTTDPSDIPNLAEHLNRSPDKNLRISMGGMMAHGMVHDESGIEWEDDMPGRNAMSNHGNTQWRLVDDDTGKVNMDIEWKFPMGSYAKIRMKNDAESMQHPMHFHGQRFLVLSSNGLAIDDLQWKDTYLLKTRETVDILLEASNPGTWMFHCHISEHLQNGMMASFIVE